VLLGLRHELSRDEQHQAREAALSALQEPDYTERSAAVHRLEELKDPEGISPLLHTLRHDPEPAVRQWLLMCSAGWRDSLKARHDEILRRWRPQSGRRETRPTAKTLTHESATPQSSRFLARRFK